MQRQGLQSFVAPGGFLLRIAWPAAGLIWRQDLSRRGVSSEVAAGRRSAKASSVAPSRCCSGRASGRSVGGLAGGVSGGLVGGSFGFGLSLVGTALGTAVDTTVQNLKDLAGALNSPNDAMAALEASGFRVGDSLKFQVEQLQAVGRAYDAQSLVLQEVERRLGEGGVGDLNQLNAAQVELQEAWSDLNGEIQRGILPTAIALTGAMADLAGGLAWLYEQSGRFDRFRKGFTERLDDDLQPWERPSVGVGQFFGRTAEERNRRPPSETDAFAAETTRIQESRRVADQIQSAYREAFKLQRQAYDLQREGADINREIADYSYRKEREIFDLRQQAAEKEIENDRAAAQNRIERGDLGARETFAAATGFEQQLLTNVREAMRTRKEGEADIEQSRRRLELTMAKLNRDAEDYKRTNAREIEDIERRKLAYTRSVEDYKMQVADYVLQRSREAADLMRQAMTLPDMSGAGGGVGGSATMSGAAFGRTGRMSLREGYGMVDLRGSSKQAIIADAADAIVNRAAMGMRTWIGGGGGLDIEATSLRGEALTAALQRGMRAHETRPGSPATAIDLIAKLGEPLGIPVGGISNRGGATGVAGTTARGTLALHLTPESVGRGAAGMQAMSATQISNIPQPRFNATPLGATPSAAPINAARMQVLARMVGNEQEAQRILEEQNRLRQKGVELGQIEQILQANQLPQLEQQYSTLQMQIEARRQNLELSDKAASVADIQAESTARIAQLEKDRANALAKARKQFTAPQELQQVTKQINEQADLAIGIARKEEEQRAKNLDLNNKLQSQERVRNEILQLQEGLAVERAQAAALERGELEASNVELLMASTLYRDAEEAQQRKLVALTAETEELRKQNEFRQQINQLQQERRFTGAGLRSGLIGEPARRFEQALNDGRRAEQANQLAQEARLLEDQQLIWANLEKNIVDVSDAISGALTNGLLDIVSGARDIEDVGRDMLNGIASTFADSAQQQLSTLLQRQIAQFAGPKLAEAIGGGAQQMAGAAAGAAGVQALGSASFVASGQVAAFGVALQTVMGQMAFSGIASGLGSSCCRRDRLGILQRGAQHS